MRRLLPLVLFALALSTAHAQFGIPPQDKYAYLPLVELPPLDLAPFVLRPTDLDLPLATVEDRQLSNDAAAQNYVDPAGALAAFDSQGRRDSWYVEMEATGNIRLRAISSQVIRYETVEGAQAGQDWLTVSPPQDAAPGCGAWRDRPVINPSFRTIKGRTQGRQRSCEYQGMRFEIGYASAQSGRFVAIVEFVRQGTIPLGEAGLYLFDAAERLPE
jgi:hypothetical protein